MKLPEFLKPILWSYDFDILDTEKDKNAIIINAINYGNLSHWRWLIKNYGKPGIKKILEETPKSSFRPQALRLAILIFKAVPQYASRSIK